MNSSLALYAAQKEGVTRFLARDVPRMILAYGTGCGKTPTSIAAMLQYLSQQNGTEFLPFARILVVAPAIVRRHWTAEFERWSGLPAYPIEMGRERKSGTKAALSLRDKAYDANIQVVSYDLLGQVDAEGWNGVIFDEIHHLSDYTSKQSKSARALMRANPGVPCIGLSATLIPTELWQLWHPMWLLFGHSWGKPPRAGKLCWDFIGRYCEVIKNEYGSAPGKPRESRQPELRKRLSEVSHRLTREDIAADLPPVDVSILEVPGDGLARGLQLVGKAPRIRPEVSYAVEWYKSLASDIHHVVILAYHRDVAQAIFDALFALGERMFIIDGSMPTDKRIEILEQVQLFDRAILIATSESIREGIRLMWAQQVLFAEWRQSPKQVLQVLGRFNSVGDRRRPQISVLTDDSLYGAAVKLTQRMAGINQLIKSGNTEQVIESAFAMAELSPDRLEKMTRTMLADGPRGQDADWSEESESMDEW